MLELQPQNKQARRQLAVVKEQSTAVNSCSSAADSCSLAADSCFLADDSSSLVVGSRQSPADQCVGSSTVTRVPNPDELTSLDQPLGVKAQVRAKECI